ncbi:MAG: hypothetical protein LBP52_02325 [Burkholderiaceae bacterium]|jgi:hypothetical protein|nr:hypothetical protein [Burkholderiaceae bacterium]
MGFLNKYIRLRKCMARLGHPVRIVLYLLVAFGSMRFILIFPESFLALYDGFELPPTSGVLLVSMVLIHGWPVLLLARQVCLRIMCCIARKTGPRCSGISSCWVYTFISSLRFPWSNLCPLNKRSQRARKHLHAALNMKTAPGVDAFVLE